VANATHSHTILSKVALIFGFAKLSTLFPNKDYQFHHIMAGERWGFMGSYREIREFKEFK
jgi:hypothetical protein